MPLNVVDLIIDADIIAVVSIMVDFIMILELPVIFLLRLIQM